MWSTKILFVSTYRTVSRVRVNVYGFREHYPLLHTYNVKNNNTKNNFCGAVRKFPKGVYLKYIYIQTHVDVIETFEMFTLAWPIHVYILHDRIYYYYYYYYFNYYYCAD